MQDAQPEEEPQDSQMAGDGAPGGLDTSFDNDYGFAEEMKTIEENAYT